MQTNEQLYGSLKSDLLGLLIDVLKHSAYAESFRKLEDVFSHHFNIPKLDLYLYEDNQFQSASACCDGRPAALEDKSGEQTAPVIAGSLIQHDEPSDFPDDTLMIRNGKREPVAMVLMKSTAAWDRFVMSACYKEFQLLLGEMIDIVKESKASGRREQNHLDLLNATKQFNSTMKMPVIYEELVRTAASNLAPFAVELIVSHEEHASSSFCRLFDYTNEEPATIDAFLSGELRIGRKRGSHPTYLNAPVKGMQGTYGVLQITATPGYTFSSAQEDFVRNICESAGHAIENSSLYNQSHRLIRDLQLVNEVSKKLTGRLTFMEMKTYLAEQLNAAFEPEEMAFVYYDRRKEPVLLDTTTDYFLTAAGSRYLEYAEKRLAAEQDAVFIADLQPGDIDGFSPYRALIIAPIIISEAVAGYTVLMHTETYHFSFDDFKLVKAIMSHSSLALSNLILRDKLQELANKDQLTDLYARGYLDRHMSESFTDGVGGAFLLIDVDDFKKVNDSHGHAVGDRVLIQTAEVLQAAIPDSAIAGRWGGEEFAVFLPGADLKDGKETAERLLVKMPACTDPSVTISIGVSVWKPSASRETYQQLFQNTDEALYAAKTGGKNRIVINEQILAE
ncbi:MULTISPECIES: sensor domain-containing diguanylate cyclase [Sporosarcina]|uniref:sensor domain-containing diguanylate cyclase n=1 Tax=Sporosarcina TaxID=1569 RepID=UPI00058D1C1D|nr:MULTISPECIES: GGDEF domain-containing protein [Sporosarcina]WJY27952.1 GGDEF domain-containing protein [Sporosarcina sp. 0.2-SM1T-5]